WASPGWVAPLAPLLKPFMHTFLDQDRQVVVKQREGLVHRPRLMLINDADTQARWWMRVKDEWIAAQSEGRPFVNPLEPKTLRCRSEAGSMHDLRALETDLLAAVAAANDEAALEAVRVAALGRNGSVSALLKTLGTMTPEARKEQGPLINSLKDRVSAALAE